METHQDVVFTHVKTLHSFSINNDSSHGAGSTSAYDQSGTQGMTLDVPADNSLAFLALTDRLRMGEFSEQSLCAALPAQAQSQSNTEGFGTMNVLASVHHSTMIKTEDPFLHAAVDSSHLSTSSDHFLFHHHQQQHGFTGNFTAMLNDGDESLPNIQTIMSSGGMHSSNSISANFHHLTVPMTDAATTYQDMISSRPTYIDESAYRDEPSFSGCASAEPGQFETIKHEVGINGVVMPADAAAGCGDLNQCLGNFRTLTSGSKRNLLNDIEDLQWNNQRKRARHKIPLSAEDFKVLIKVDDKNGAEKLSNLDATIKRGKSNLTAILKGNNSASSFENKVCVSNEEKKWSKDACTSCPSLYQADNATSRTASELSCSKVIDSVLDHSSLTQQSSDSDLAGAQTARDTSKCKGRLSGNSSEGTPIRRNDRRAKQSRRCIIDSTVSDSVSANWPNDAELGDTIAEAVADTSPTATMLGSRGAGEKLEVKVDVEEGQCVTVEGVRRWRCLQCPKMYSTKHNLIVHILGHSGIKPHCCGVCSKLFSQISHLQTHLLTHGGAKPHVCHVCQRSFTQASHVKRHLVVHLGARREARARGASSLMCTQCDRAFAYPSELRLHMEQRHRVQGAEHACDECGTVCDGADELRRHKLAEHRRADGLACKVCAKVYAYPSQLRDHAASHEGARPYICGECGLDFMKEHHLKSHMFTHTGLRPFQCKQCPRAFNQKANLQRHLLIHNGEKKFACDMCGRGFVQYQILRAHLITHADTKPFQCKVCGKGFSRLHNLNGHMHMHDGGKPFLCSCGATFTLKGNLNRHKRDKHGQTAECPEESGGSGKLVRGSKGGLGKKAARSKQGSRTGDQDHATKILSKMSSRKPNSTGNSVICDDETGAVWEMPLAGGTGEVRGEESRGANESGDAGEETRAALEKLGSTGAEDYTGERGGAATPKKKRKSMPPRKTTPAEGADNSDENEEDVRAAWQLAEERSLAGDEETSGSEGVDEEGAEGGVGGARGVGGEGGGRAWEEEGCSGGVCLLTLT